jgi:cysteine synthase
MEDWQPRAARFWPALLPLADGPEYVMVRRSTKASRQGEVGSSVRRCVSNGYVPPILDVTRLDRKVLVSNEDSVAAVRELLLLEGILGGVSSGAALHVARRLAGELDEGVVVTVLADGGWKYLSADFWDAPDEDVESSMESTVWW